MSQAELGMQLEPSARRPDGPNSSTCITVFNLDRN